jgi:hypothetical protein
VLEEVYATSPLEAADYPSTSTGNIEIHNLANDVNALVSPPTLTGTPVGENDIRQPLSNAIPVSAQTHVRCLYTYYRFI